MKPRIRPLHYQQQIARESWEKECRVAELLSEEMSLTEIAVTMGMSYPSATVYWRRIRQRLGWQAR